MIISTTVHRPLRLIPLLAVCLASACTHLAPAPERSVAALRLIGEQRIPHSLAFRDTTVGGLSGVDYDAATGRWLLASDDRSATNPARFYTARLHYDGAAFTQVELQDVHLFRQPDGTPYPGVKVFDVQRTGDVPDIEALRIDPLDGSLWYASEGDGKRELQPFVRQAASDGGFRAALPIPAMFRFRPDGAGLRDNYVFEGMAFAPDGQSLWLSLEAPLIQDGPAPTPEHGAVARITQLDRAGNLLAQYAYPVDAVPAVPGAGKACDNGIVEILAVSGHELLVLERSAVQGADGVWRNYVRLYAMDTRGADDVRDIAALAGARYRPAAKRLVLDLNTLGIRIDNLEALSWGPKLANGHDTLVVVSDDNFSQTQITQLLAFEVIPFR